MRQWTPSRPSTDGACRIFEKGRIHWSPTDSSCEVNDSIGRTDVVRGGPTGRLGFPVTGATEGSEKSVVQRFQGGMIICKPGLTIGIDDTDRIASPCSTARLRHVRARPGTLLVHTGVA